VLLLRHVSAAVALGMLTACWRPTGQLDYVEPRIDPPKTGGATILSAQFSRDAAVDGTETDAIVLVFDREIDPASLAGRAFMIVLSDGARMRAPSATLGPASERDENRTVTLHGELGTPGGPEPVEVVVIERIWDEDGGGLLGAAAKVTPHGTAPRLVAVHPLPGATQGTGCRGPRVRTYWSDLVTPLIADLGQALQVELADGSAVAPSQLDDVVVNGSDTSDDNVVDLCLEGAIAPRIVRIAAGSFVTPAGAECEASAAMIEMNDANDVPAASVPAAASVDAPDRARAGDALVQ
jgi:hypothetical protein